jgi:hypothetical protein
MMTRTSRSIHERLAQLEAAAEGAGRALICPHQSSEELHSALIGEYLRSHAFKQTAGFIAGIFAFAALLILF